MNKAGKNLMWGSGIKGWHNHIGDLRMLYPEAHSQEEVLRRCRMLAKVQGPRRRREP